MWRRRRMAGEQGDGDAALDGTTVSYGTSSSCPSAKFASTGDLGVLSARRRTVTAFLLSSCIRPVSRAGHALIRCPETLDRGRANPPAGASPRHRVMPSAASQPGMRAGNPSRDGSRACAIVAERLGMASPAEGEDDTASDPRRLRTRSGSECTSLSWPRTFGEQQGGIHTNTVLAAGRLPGTCLGKSSKVPASDAASSFPLARLDRGIKSPSPYAGPRS